MQNRQSRMVYHRMIQPQVTSCCVRWRKRGDKKGYEQKEDRGKWWEKAEPGGEQRKKNQEACAWWTSIQQYPVLFMFLFMPFYSCHATSLCEIRISYLSTNLLLYEEQVLLYIWPTFHFDHERRRCCAIQLWVGPIHCPMIFIVFLQNSSDGDRKRDTSPQYKHRAVHRHCAVKIL